MLYTYGILYMYTDSDLLNLFMIRVVMKVLFF